MKKNAGFTLIEIIMVLVLIGILAAVAVPKYFDLHEQAQQKAAMAFGAECQARLNGALAQGLLAGSSCYAATEEAVKEMYKISSEKKSGFTISKVDYEETGVMTLGISPRVNGVADTTKTYTFVGSVPTCRFVTP